MTQDPTNRYIAAILSRCDLNGKELLEIGCGRGRITRDLVRHAGRVLACDPDEAALEIARSVVLSNNVEFRHAPGGMPDLPAASFDVVIYTLSLHHVPIEDMPDSLHKAGRLLRRGGVIVVVEPGDGGSFAEAKERFGAGSGDERPAREAAIRAMHALDGWIVKETILFRTLFRFDDDNDFLVNMLPNYRQQAESFVNEVCRFLDQYRAADGITLDACRKLIVLCRTNQKVC